LASNNLPEMKRELDLKKDEGSILQDIFIHVKHN
jgi:hypothetical protein